MISPIAGEKYEFEAISHELTTMLFIGSNTHSSIITTAFYAISKR
jgi:hypothetical protein